MAKTVTFTYKDKDYTLEFTRATIKELEREGFDAGSLEEADKRPVESFEKLFEGAFKAHHRRIKKETINAIWNAMPNKMELLQTLAELYASPINAMFDEPDEDSKNVIQWTAND